MRFRIVVFPAPDVPRGKTNSLLSIVNETSSKAATPNGYDFMTFSNWIMNDYWISTNPTSNQPPRLLRLKGLSHTFIFFPIYFERSTVLDVRYAFCDTPPDVPSGSFPLVYPTFSQIPSALSLNVLLSTTPAEVFVWTAAPFQSLLSQVIFFIIISPPTTPITMVSTQINITARTGKGFGVSVAFIECMNPDVFIWYQHIIYQNKNLGLLDIS